MGDQSAEQSVRRLLSSAALINQAVGDALSDLLFCEAVLRLKGWGCEVNPDCYPKRRVLYCVFTRICAATFTAIQRVGIFFDLYLLCGEVALKGASGTI